MTDRDAKADTVTQANRDISALQPIAQKACSLFLSECKKRNIPIFITETHRSQARQDYLYEQGRSRPGNIVTWTRSSNHTAGYAWDIAVSPPHNLYDVNIINKAGQVAKELSIEWGGTWKEKDTPHFQVDKNWKEPTIDTNYLKAIDKLVEKKIISNRDIWEKETYSKENVKSLIIKVSSM